MDAIEILNSVEQFYNSAWNKLILFTSILIAFGAILIPLFITWWQNRNLKIREDSLKRELEILFENKFTPLKSELIELINKQSSEKFAEFEKQFSNKLGSIQAFVYHVQGNILLKEKKHIEAIDNYISAGARYLIDKQFTNLYRVNENIIKVLQKITTVELEDLEIEKVDISAYIQLLEKNNENGIFFDVIKNIKKEVKELKKKETPAN